MLGVVLTMSWAGEAFAQKRVALILGNADYRNIGRLQNPLNDAPDFAEALRKLGFDVILRTNVDKSGFDRALAEFARKVPGSEAALFYYAGHGIQYQKQNYLLPTDIQVQDYADIEFQAISINGVMRALDRTNGVKIVILDACRDNPLEKQVVASSRSTLGATRGLARIDQTQGTVVAYATASDRVALDGVGRNSPFTESLIRRLDEPGLEIATLFRRVAQDVFDRTNGEQRPEYSISLLGDFYMNNMQSDADAFRQIEDSNNPEDFANFIRQFPNSSRRSAAESRIRLLNMLLAEAEARRRERQEREAREAESRRMAQQLRELEEMFRRDREQRAAEDAARKRQAEEAQRRAQEQQEADRRRIAAQIEEERERQAAEAAERQRVAEQQAEQKRRDDEAAAALKRQQDEQRRIAEAELKAKQDAERKRLAEEVMQEKLRRQAEADLKAQQDAERKRLDDERRAQVAEAERRKREAEQAEAARRQADEAAERRRVADVCVREAAVLDGLVTARERAGAEALRGQAKCPTIGAKIDDALKRIDAAVAQACAADRKLLDSAGQNLTALQSAADTISCAPVKEQARVQLARLVEAEAQRQQVCAAEQAAIVSVVRTSLDAGRKLDAIADKLACARLVPELKSIQATISARAKATQTALRHMGCYAGPVSGEFDRATVGGLTAYFKLRGHDLDDIHVTDEVVDELKDQPRNFCKPQPEAAPVAKSPAKGKPVAARPVEQPSARKPARAAPPRKVAREAPARPSRPAPPAAARPAPPAVASAPPRLRIHGVGF